MRRREETCLALAVQANKLAYVLLRGDQLLYWQTSTDANRTIDAMYAFVGEQLRYYRPDVFLTEDHHGETRKRETARALLEAAGSVAEEVGVAHVTIPRKQHFKNKYLEAEAIAREYPELLRRVPKKRRPWQKEPTDVVLFEAMALWFTYAGVEFPVDDEKPDDDQLRLAW